MNLSADSTRVVHPLFQGEDDGSRPISALQVSKLVFEPCRPEYAARLVRAWHSRLPNCQDGPWQYAFHARFGDVSYAVALWNNPSGRCLPSHWLEMRRMACSPDAPKNTPSRFLGWMVRWFSSHCPEREKCISYQDLEVHTGTIYKAAGWQIEYVSKARVRDRSKRRIGTRRMYRTNLNGVEKDAAPKARWAKTL